MQPYDDIRGNIDWFADEYKLLEGQLPRFFIRSGCSSSMLKPAPGKARIVESILRKRKKKYQRLFHSLSSLARLVEVNRKLSEIISGLQQEYRDKAAADLSGINSERKQTAISGQIEELTKYEIPDLMNVLLPKIIEPAELVVGFNNRELKETASAMLSCYGCAYSTEFDNFRPGVIRFNQSQHQKLRDVKSAYPYNSVTEVILRGIIGRNQEIIRKALVVLSMGG